MINHIAIIGAGSGGNAAAVDLALQGKGKANKARSLFSISRT